MLGLTTDQQKIVSDLVNELSAIPGIEALVLAGSYARGWAQPDSDIDLGLLYSETNPFPIPAIRAISERFNDVPDPVVSDFFGWGPWVNGGAWLTIKGQRVDLLYRSLEQIDRVLRDAEEGRYELHYGQQPPFGFFSPTYLGEVSVAVPLFDPRSRVGLLKQRVVEYPEALRRTVVQNNLWAVEFGLAGFARKFASRGDVYATVGCLARFINHLVLAIFALNRAYLINDKTAFAEIASFPIVPQDFRTRAEAALACPGRSAQDLALAVEGVAALFRETVALAGDLYVPRSLPSPDPRASRGRRPG